MICDMTTRYGTPPHKLHRREGPFTSIDAAHTTDTTTWEQAVHHAIQHAGPLGISAKACLLEHWPWKDFSSISGRFSALKAKKLVMPTGTKDDHGSEILVAIEHAHTWWFTQDEIDEWLAT